MLAPTSRHYGAGARRALHFGDLRDRSQAERRTGRNGQCRRRWAVMPPWPGSPVTAP